ncbi:MAG: SAM-dependent methyltransferase, partial [Acidimicrobiales bacterium]
MPAEVGGIGVPIRYLHAPNVDASGAPSVAGVSAETMLRDVIERHGPVGFDVLVDIALYNSDHGFYATGGKAGRRGDFITSPEVGPLFGAVVARALDNWWREAGEPEVFVVVEAGAGPGTLAKSVVRAEPACARALRYVLVESSAAQRAQHTTGLVLGDSAAAFAALTIPDDDGPRADLPNGPIVVSVPHLPRLPGPCVVLANELLDNLPFGLAERTADGWDEVRVGLAGDSLVEVRVPLGADEARSVKGLAPQATPGDRIPMQRAAASWLADARALAGASGRVVAFDYATTTADLAARPQAEWLRTYRG